jgi:hypothetical protein
MTAYLKPWGPCSHTTSLSRRTATRAPCHNVSVIWLGNERGELSDWVTQRWVHATGRKFLLADQPCLDGPIGNTRQIGRSFFENYAVEANLELVQDGVRGLIPDFRSLEGEAQSLAAVAPEVKRFYEQTSATNSMRGRSGTACSNLSEAF